MTKRFIATLIASLAFAGSVHATEPTESVEFMNDHALQSVEGAKLAKGFSASELNSMTKSISLRERLDNTFSKQLIDYSRYLRDRGGKYYIKNEVMNLLSKRAASLKQKQQIAQY